MRVAIGLRSHRCSVVSLTAHGPWLGQTLHIVVRPGAKPMPNGPTFRSLLVVDHTALGSIDNSPVASGPEPDVERDPASGAIAPNRSPALPCNQPSARMNFSRCAEICTIPRPVSQRGYVRRSRPTYRERHLAASVRNCANRSLRPSIDRPACCNNATWDHRCPRPALITPDKAA